MQKRANPNFFKNGQGPKFTSEAENFVIGAENYKPPPEGFYDKGGGMVKGDTQSKDALASNKSLVAAYKRAKMTGNFIF